MRAVGGFVHPMAFFQQLEELLYWDSRVRRTSQRENLPHQDSKRPTVEAKPKRSQVCAVPVEHVCIRQIKLECFIVFRVIWTNWDSQHWGFMANGLLGVAAKIRLTHRSGVCRLCQTRPLVPSISLADVPKIRHETTVSTAATFSTAEPKVFLLIRTKNVHPFPNPPPTIQLSPIKLPANQQGHTKHLSLKALVPQQTCQIFTWPRVRISRISFGKQPSEANFISTSTS